MGRNCVDAVSVQVGSMVIVNEFDRPCPDLVAQVLEIDQDQNKAVVRYISFEIDRSPFSVPLNRLTSVEMFGVSVARRKNWYTIARVCESNARYPDGKIRHWQDQVNGSHLMNFHAYLSFLCIDDELASEAE
jgi:hypothetical protein